MSLDGTVRYCLDPKVALRAEPFGALAYHYGSRRLTFLRSPELADLLRRLGEFASLDEALSECIPAQSRRSYRRALQSLAESEFICAA
ncbi:MAG: mycofactocin biosynthesis chaperone MftB [Acidimicrobiales bacterium]|nr:mycofactocin biosynthesis chaperone MftB [Acidimicrobiales bacterium]